MRPGAPGGHGELAGGPEANPAATNSPCPEQRQVGPDLQNFADPDTEIKTLRCRLHRWALGESRRWDVARAGRCISPPTTKRVCARSPQHSPEHTPVRLELPRQPHSTPAGSRRTPQRVHSHITRTHRTQHTPTVHTHWSRLPSRPFASAEGLYGWGWGYRFSSPDQTLWRSELLLS